MISAATAISPIQSASIHGTHSRHEGTFLRAAAPQRGLSRPPNSATIVTLSCPMALIAAILALLDPKSLA
jgi:hypothetical protein